MFIQIMIAYHPILKLSARILPLSTYPFRIIYDLYTPHPEIPIIIISLLNPFERKKNKKEEKDCKT